MRERYWKQMTQYKFELCYFEAHLSGCYKIKNIINIVCAAFSTTAISVWAVWNNFAFFSSLTIVVTQILISLQDALLYKDRIKELNSIRYELIPIYNEMEFKWYDVSIEKLTDEEINEILYRFVQRWSQIKNKFFVNDELPLKHKYINKAEERKNKYFKCFYGE